MKKNILRLCEVKFELYVKPSSPPLGSKSSSWLFDESSDETVILGVLEEPSLDCVKRNSPPRCVSRCTTLPIMLTLIFNLQNDHRKSLALYYKNVFMPYQSSGTHFLSHLYCISSSFIQNNWVFYKTTKRVFTFD